MSKLLCIYKCKSQFAIFLRNNACAREIANEADGVPFKISNIKSVKRVVSRVKS